MSSSTESMASNIALRIAAVASFVKPDHSGSVQRAFRPTACLFASHGRPPSYCEHTDQSSARLKKVDRRPITASGEAGKRWIPADIIQQEKITSGARLFRDPRQDWM